MNTELTQQPETSLQYESCLIVANFVLWIATALKEGRALPHLTTTLPQEWAQAATALHCEGQFAKTGRAIRLRKETQV